MLLQNDYKWQYWDYTFKANWKMIQFDAAMKDRIISANIIVLFLINPFQVGGSFKILLWHKVNGQARNQITKKWQLVHIAGFMWLRFLATVLCKALKIPVVTQTINTPNDIVKFDFAFEASIFLRKANDLLSYFSDIIFMYKLVIGHNYW